jgi:signal transduction histidine kinase
MIVNKVFASYTFRFLSAYVASLSVAVMIILVIVYLTLSRGYFDKLNQSIIDEQEVFSQIYQREGVAGARAYIDSQMASYDRNRFFYLVVDRDYRKLVGNLDSWPSYTDYGGGWLSFELDILELDDESVNSDFVGRSAQLPGGEYVLAARLYEDVIESASLVSGALFRSMLVTIVLGTIGGAIVAGMSVKRIDAMNKSIRRIMVGDLSERIKVSDQQGDFRELAYNINLMLDRIQSLMNGVRQVSDNVAHDLRTPLTRLKNHLEDLQQQVPEASQDKVLQLIEEADGLLATFNALLRIAQVETGNRRAGFTRLDPRVILLDVVELYEPLALDKSLQLTVELAQGLSMAGDRDLLFQAFANLLDNAIKYTPEQGLIHLSMVGDGNSVRISVADSGCGIPLQDKKKAFGRFFRVEASRSQQPGNGLGLSLVLAVINLHNGEIFLTDNNPGLKVEIELPVQA